MKIAATLAALADYSYEYTNEAAGAAAGISSAIMVIALLLSVLMIVAEWKLFSKAGEPGWFCIVPLLNVFTLFKIVYGSGWKCLLMFVPILNSIVSIAFYIRMAQVYGKGIGFGILTVLFSPIALLILAFGNSSYQGPVNSFI